MIRFWKAETVPDDAASAARAARTPLTRRPPPPLSDKIRRGLWGIAHALAFGWTPIPLHGWRALVLRVFGAEVGAKAAIYPSAQIWAPWNLKIGDGATIGGAAILYSVDHIEIGDGAIISQGAHLCAASHDHNAADFALITAPIVIGHGAWVAAEAFIGPGVAIGDGAVAAARAVVMRDVPARAIVAGNPARVIGMRADAGKNALKGRV